MIHPPAPAIPVVAFRSPHGVGLIRPSSSGNLMPRMRPGCPHRDRQMVNQRGLITGNEPPIIAGRRRNVYEGFEAGADPMPEVLRPNDEPAEDRDSSGNDFVGTPQQLAFERLLADLTAALRASEQRFRAVADFCYDWEYWLAPDGRLLYVSPSCERITGYRA